MTYRWLERARSAGVAFVSAACVFGCGASSILKPTPEAGVSSVHFDTSGVLTLTPKQTVVLDLTGSGVSNATLSLAGNYLDAFLDADAVDLSNGHGEVTLRAPSSPSTFSILASTGVTSARLDVAVSATGFATVRVTTDYQGKRAVPIVAASTFVETTCAKLGGKAVDGSPLVVGTDGEKLVIDSVPTDGQVAVSVRIAHYATGCFDVPSLAPNDVRDVTVTVFDLPLDLGDTTLETRFGFAANPSDTNALATYFEQLVGSAVLTASFSSSGSESSRLLDAMQAASTSPTQFASARAQKYWDTATGSWLGQHTPSMHDRTAQWLTAAAQAGTGDLTGHIDGAPAKPLFTPKMLGAIDAQLAGVTAPLPFSWSGQANDVLSLSGAITIVPSQLACAAADVQAKLTVPLAAGVADALVTSIDCTGLGVQLAQSGYAFAQCDGACMGDLCASAIANLWAVGAASLSKPADVLTLSLSVAAPAQVGEAAQVEAYQGAWVGSFGYGTSSVATKGVAKAAYGTTPN